MTCPYCGAQNEPGFQFCKTCGAKLAAKPAAPQQPQYQAPQQPQYQAPQQPQYQAPQPQYQQYQAPQQRQYQAPQQPQYQAPRQPQYRAPVATAPKKNPFEGLIKKVKSIDFGALLKDPKKLIIPAAAVAAVLVLVILISIIGAIGSGAATPKTGYYAVEMDDEYFLLQDAKVVESGLEDVYIYTSSLDGSVAVYESDDELFVVRNGKSISITDEWDDMRLSVNGSALVVLDYDGVLTSYDTKNGESTEIAEEVCWFCVSPDGKSVAYVVEDDGEYPAFLFKGKDSIELGEDLIPIAVSNGAKVIYCIDDEKGSLCTVDTKGNTEKIANDVYENAFYMNEDHTQMIFQAGGKWYATVKGGEKIKLTSDYDFNILGYQYESRFVDYYEDLYLTYPTADLRNCFVALDDSIAWMNNKWELTKAAKDVEEAYVSADGKTLVFLKGNGKLQKVTSNKLDKPVELAEDVWTFMPTSDCSAVYYINDDDELFFQKGTGKAKKVSDDVDGGIVTPGDVFLFSSDEELYSSKNGGKKVKIHDEIDDIDMSGTTIYLWTDYDDGEFTFSALTKGSKFKEIDLG